MPLDTLIEGEFVIEATVTVLQRKHTDWKVAGIGILKDERNYWHIALVESPHNQGSYHAVEIKEMNRGVWGSQTDLPGFSFNMDGNSPDWLYDIPYRLKFVFANGTITGQVCQNGEVISRMTLVVNRDTPNTGIPVIHLVGLDATFEAFSIRLPIPGEAAVGDSFGQSTFTTWSDKVKSNEDLRHLWQVEEGSIKRFASNPDLDAFGGLKATSVAQSRFFRIEKLQDKWWFITPLGHPFISLGINVVDVTDTYTNVYAGFGKLFDVPQVEKDRYSFYVKNLCKRYGDSYLERWLNSSQKRLRAWGFNTLGAWSIIPGDNKLPYTIHFSSFDDHLSLINSKFPDVFSKEFEEDFEEIAKSTADFRTDPYLIGYFVDGELLWSGEAWTDEPFSLVDQVMSLPKDAPAKKALVDFLSKKYRNKILEFNKTYNTNLRSFADLYNHPVSNFSRGNEENAREFLRLIAHQYFATISRVLKATDPNHLYLGCKFSWWPNESTIDEIADIIGLYVDVVSFDVYDFKIDRHAFESYADKAKKAILIGEFSFSTRDRGLGGACSVINQKERGKAYRYFVENAISLPYVVGCHWFEYVDQPLTGRFDGENFNYGLVDVCDIPYWDLVSQARETNQRIYDIHHGRLPPFSEAPERAGE